MKQFSCFLMVVALVSCHLPPGDAKHLNATANTYRLLLNPNAGSSYHYDVNTTTLLKIEADENKIETSNESVAGVNYVINKDTIGNYLFSMKYDKLQLNSKNGENETNLDADRGKLSSNPTERMLGLLKEANLTAVVTSNGTVREVRGYNDLSIQLLSMLDPNDITGRQLAQQRLDKMIGGEMVKNTLSQLFKIFPDSAVHVGDKWRIDSKQEGQLNTTSRTYFKLTDINNEIAFLSANSDISSDNNPIDIGGQNVVANLKGKQEAKYELETKTGMLLNSKIESQIKGTLKMNGRDMPVEIKVNVEIKGKNLSK